LAMQMAIAFVIRIDRHRSVAQHGLRTRGRNRDEFLCARYGITDLVELAIVFLVHDLEIGDGGHASWAPIDDVFAAVDQPFIPEADEALLHRARQALVHGEVFAVPINGIAQALHLADNGAAVELLPLPHAFNEFFAAEVAAAYALSRKLALYQHLRSDAGVICSRDP